MRKYGRVAQISCPATGSAGMDFVDLEQALLSDERVKKSVERTLKDGSRRVSRVSFRDPASGQQDESYFCHRVLDHLKPRGYSQIPQKCSVNHFKWKCQSPRGAALWLQ